MLTPGTSSLIRRDSPGTDGETERQTDEKIMD